MEGNNEWMAHQAWIMEDIMVLHSEMSMGISYHHRQATDSLGCVETHRKIAWEVDMGITILEVEADPQVATEAGEDQDMAEEASIPTCVAVMDRHLAEVALMAWWVLWQEEQWWEVDEEGRPDTLMVMDLIVESHLVVPTDQWAERQRLGQVMEMVHIVVTMAVTFVTVYLEQSHLHQCQE
jgi:hypothetical protein